MTRCEFCLEEAGFCEELMHSDDCKMKITEQKFHENEAVNNFILEQINLITSLRREIYHRTVKNGIDEKEIKKREAAIAVFGVQVP